MESFVADLKNKVQCPLCKQTLADPKLADCFHTFCKMCIKTNTQLDEEGTNVFKCPQCDSQTLLQDLNDVEYLQDSPIQSKILQVLEFVENEKICSVSASHPQALYQCLDCNEPLCEECLRCHSKFTKNHKVVLFSDLKKEDIEKMLKKESPCKTHDNQDVELYCRDCDLLICLQCLKEQHHNHHTKTLHEFAAIKQDSLHKTLERIVNISKDETEKQRQEQFALLIQRHGEKAKQQIKDLTRKLMKSLEENERQLLNEVEQYINKADNNLRIIRHPTQAQEYISSLLDNGTASDLASLNQERSSSSTVFNPFPQDTTDFLFHDNQELCAQVEHGLGLVRPFKKADRKMSSIKIDNSSLNIRVSKKSELTVDLKTREGDVTDETLENVSVQFTPEDNVKVEAMQMADDGVITVDFVPRVCDELTVNVQVQGNDISNTPLVIAVKPQEIKQVTGYFIFEYRLNTGSKNFTGIAVNKVNSKIAVADFESHCVRVFNMEGDVLLTYGSEGSGQGQLNRPMGIAFLNDNDLVIADRGNHRICVVNTITGQLVRSFGRRGDGNSQFNNPHGVHDDNENIIVCDYGNNRVQVFTKHGDYLYQFSIPSPYSVITHNGLFYVSGYKNPLVNVIEMTDNQSATTVCTIGDNNKTENKLQSANGLAIDHENRLLVCDHSGFLIHKFTLDGSYVGQSGKLDRKPRYIAVLHDGQIICTTIRGVVIFNSS